MRQKELSDYSSTGSECPTCGDGFKSDHGVKIHHKHAHGESIAGNDQTCEYCGDIFTTWRDQRFCSQDCHYSYQEEVAASSKIEVKCRTCGDVMERYPSQTSSHNFCSHTCYSEWVSKTRSGENHPSYSGGKEAATCPECGGEFEDYPSQIPGRTYCSEECYYEAERRVKGKDHPCWRGGKSVYESVKKQLGEVSWVTKRERAKGADNYVCQNPDCSETENLHTHHIVPIMVGGTNGLWNLITLCESCHASTEAYCRSLPEFEPLLVE